MRVVNTPDPPSIRTTMSFSDDEVMEALMEYAKKRDMEFNLSEKDHIFLLTYRSQQTGEKNVTQVVIDREGTITPPVREMKNELPEM